MQEVQGNKAANSIVDAAASLPRRLPVGVTDGGVERDTAGMTSENSPEVLSAM